jgi:hypothetical protein
METALGGCGELGAAWVASELGEAAGLLEVPEWLAVVDAGQTTANLAGVCRLAADVRGLRTSVAQRAPRWYSRQR